MIRILKENIGQATQERERERERQKHYYSTKTGFTGGSTAQLAEAPT